MTLLNTEQAIHDRINLSRLVKRLEKSLSEDNYNFQPEEGIHSWLSAQRTFQVKHPSLSRS